MAINSVGYGPTILNQSLLNLNNQLTQLQSQLTTGKKSTAYAGMGVNEGFAIAARSQLSNISAFSDTQSNVNTTIGLANTALQSMVDIGTTVLNSAASTMQTLNSAGQTIAQQTANSQLSSMLGILNMQAGDRYLFSGAGINTPAVASIDNILNGTTTQAGLKQVIAERAQADGTTGLGRLIVAAPTTTSVQVVEDAAGSPFGLKLSAVSSSLTGATVTGPAGSPSGVSINLGATNPNDGDKVSFDFKLPDGTTESIQLTASSATPPPTGSFAIGATPAATATNLNAALTTAIGTLANTSLVAASAVEAGNDFFNPTTTVAGSAVNNKAAIPGSITGATLLSGAAGTNSLATNFAAGDTITVNGASITFVNSGAVGNNQVNVTDSIQTLLSKIDSITGTSTPSTVSDGVIALNADNGASVAVKSSNSAAFAALGFGAVATQPPLGVAGGLVNNQATTPAPITGATLLSGLAGTDSLSSSFVAGNTITVNGTPITFVASGAVGNQLNVTDNVQTLLSKIDSITGTSIPSTVSGGAIALRSNTGASLTVASSNLTAFAALGFSATATATLPPLQVAGSVVSNQAATPAPITGVDAAVRRRGHELVGHQFRGRQHHYRQRHAHHLCRLRRGWQPAQRHRQRPDDALENRFAHRHHGPVDHQRRQDRTKQQQRREPDRHEFELGRVRGARPRHLRAGDRAAAAGQRFPTGDCDGAGQRHAGQYGHLVYRRSGPRIRPRDGDLARRPVGDRCSTGYAPTSRPFVRRFKRWPCLPRSRHLRPIQTAPCRSRLSASEPRRVLRPNPGSKPSRTSSRILRPRR